MTDDINTVENLQLDCWRLQREPLDVAGQRDALRSALASERASRFELERRFDHRLEGIGVAERAQRWCDHAAVPRPDEWAQCREDVQGLLLWAQGLAAGRGE